MGTGISQHSFQGKPVRMVDRNGAVWFVAIDVARALGYRDTDRLVRWLDEDEKGTHIVGTVSTDPHGRGGGEQEMVIISESGLYHALLKSRKPVAKPFRKWVTADVLPTVRRKGIRGDTDPQGSNPYHAGIRDLPYPRPESVLGPFFSVPQDHLLFQGVDVRKLLTQFRAALQLSREIASLDAEYDNEEEILRSAIHVTNQVTGADLSLLFRAKPLHAESFCDHFFSPTQLGLRFQLQPPATKVNAILVELGLQIRGNEIILYYPTAQGLAYAEYRSFVQSNGNTRTHLFWRPSVIPVIEDYFAETGRGPAA